jgi:hypothetical protein
VDLQALDDNLCEKKARSIHAFRNGKPSNIFAITPDADATFSDQVLVHETLIWRPRKITEESRIVCVLNLKTWQLRTLRGEALEKINHVVASDRIVVLITFTGICYVSDLHGTTTKKFRVPSMGYFQTVSCRGCTVACVATFANHQSVYIWDYDTQRGRSFQINHDPGSILVESVSP